MNLSVVACTCDVYSNITENLITDVGRFKLLK